MIYSKVLIIGDSLSNLSRDTSTYGLELAKLFKFKEGVTVVPLIYAYSGWTSNQIIFEMPKIFEKHKDVKEVVVQFGTNDAKDEVATPLDDFMSTLQLVKSWARVYGFRLYFLTIPIPKGFGSPGYTNNIIKRVKKYNKAIREVFGDMVIEITTKQFADGIHYNRKGNIEVASAIYRKIKGVRNFG